jgi:transposase
MNVLCLDIFQKSLLEHIAQKTNKPIEEMTKSLALIMDRASCHTEATRREEIKYVFLPPACPELSPAERFLKELRKEHKLRLFQSLQLIEEKIAELLKKYWQNPKAMIKLTNFQYINTQ